uniref:Uncharacterized protein n=2 Tax=Candidatus Kentrum sp. FM TaxID=2126340 RepID=A0A450TJK9_9GAMM|nr:MAG: hypothetical protein BECKFM1743A_GA0114220_104541 [Candidatus Kentron sp. FM]
MPDSPLCPKVAAPPRYVIRIPSINPESDKSLKEYTNLLVFIVELRRCTAVTWLMRLPRALNLNENPAQFGIFFSANRLSGREQ